jgi:hypothetical protein
MIKLLSGTPAGVLRQQAIDDVAEEDVAEEDCRNVLVPQRANGDLP